MLQSLFFLVSFLSCLISLILYPKTNESQSFIREAVFAYVLQLSIGSLFAFILSFFSLPINLISMSLVYILISIIIFTIIVNKKKLQRHHIDLYDNITLLLLVCFILFTIWRVFTFNLNLNYYSTDSAAHFSFAMDIVRTAKLPRMFFAPLYNALFIQLFSPIYPGIYAYKAFILAESLSALISGMIFYSVLREHCSFKNITKYSPIITLLYFAAWPLYNYTVGGFVYWGISVTLILYGLHLLFLFQKRPDKYKALLIILIINFFSISMCYMLFIPYIAITYSLVLFFLFFKKLKEFYYTKKKLLIGVILITLFLCFGIFHLAFFIYFKGNIQSLFSAVSIEGGILKNIYRDFTFFIPFIVYNTIKTIKNKTINIWVILYNSYFVLVLGSLGLCLLGIISTYYYYKLYFLLWALSWYITLDSFDSILKEIPYFIQGYITMLSFIFIFTFTPIEDIMLERNLIEYTTPEFPIYSYMGSYLKSPDTSIYNDDYWEVIEYVSDNISPIPLCGDKHNYMKWYAPITGYNYIYHESDEVFKELFIDKNYTDSEKFAFLKSSSYYDTFKIRLDQKYTPVFENDCAVIYTIKK